MEFTNADLNFMKLFAKRIETLCKEYPKTSNCKVLNAYRLIKSQELPKLKRKIGKWESLSIGGQVTNR